MAIIDEITRIDWHAFDTAYGNAAEDIPYYVASEDGRGYTPKVASSLLNLFSDHKETALQASHDLWCGLCHQHTFVSSAALPAYDILFYGLQQLNDDLKIEILDILMGFAICISEDTPVNTWQGQLREKLKRDKSFFQTLNSHINEDIAYFSRSIVTEL